MPSKTDREHWVADGYTHRSHRVGIRLGGTLPATTPAWKAAIGCCTPEAYQLGLSAWCRQWRGELHIQVGGLMHRQRERDTLVAGTGRTWEIRLDDFHG